MTGAHDRREAYTAAFYAGCADVSARSAHRVVGHVMELLAPGPASVVDVGCGLGTWLRAFSAAGVETVLGIDGDHVDRAALRISPDSFIAADLDRPLPRPLPGARPQRFELAVSLEVAEHLAPDFAAGFVGELAQLAPAVLFSAALPRQGGTCHRNEQWPEYWAALFAERGYLTVDCIRPRIWSDAQVAYYYAQNILLFAEPAAVEARPALRPFLVPPGAPLARGHRPAPQEPPRRGRRGALGDPQRDGAAAAAGGVKKKQDCSPRRPRSAALLLWPSAGHLERCNGLRALEAPSAPPASLR